MLVQRFPLRLLLLALVTLVAPLLLFGAVATAQTTGTAVSAPASFTSTFSVTASADEVPAADDGTRGEPGATGVFDLQLNSDEEIVCYDITLRGVTPPFESPAPTATHIHDSPAGVVGPAVVLFPNPEMSGDGTLQTSGCLQDAFTADAVTAGFSLADIEAVPTDYYVDNHTSAFVPGSVRGQFSGAAPAGGVPTGAGGSSTQDASTLLVAVAAGLTALAAAGLGTQALLRRRSD